MRRYGGVGIEHDGGPLEAGRDLREQLKPLASQRGFHVGEAGSVPARLVEPRDDAAGDGIARARKDDRDRPRLPLEGNGRRGRVCHYDVGLQADQLLRERSYPIDVIAAPPKVDPHVAAIVPTQARKLLNERRVATFPFRIAVVKWHEHTNPPRAVDLLRPRRKRQYRCGAAKQGKELAPPDAVGT